MSADEVNRDIRMMTQSGKLAPSVAKEALNHPIEGEKIVRLERIEQQNSRMELSLFGNSELGIGGLIKDMIYVKEEVRGIKTKIDKSTWMISGAITLGSLLVTAAAFWANIRH